MSDFKKIFYIHQATKIEICGFYDFACPFPLHFHDHILIGCLVHGKRQFTYGTIYKTINEFELVTIAPGCPHACKPKGNINSTWLCLNIPISGLDFLGFNVNNFQNSIYKDRTLGYDFVNLHFLLQKSLPSGLAALKTFIQRILLNTQRNDKPISPDLSPNIINNICLRMSENLEDKITLNEMRTWADLDKYEFIRKFSSFRCMTPYRYRKILRLNYGQAMLRKGIAISESALCAGFYDQSHFSKCFLANTGFTPGFYRYAYLR